ncbi:hypothetical protein [Pedobacter metabolipauper]|uniref:TolB-like protein n=1 Tax=Pedobacter metabolipauper TaxID=425513 RepID=A0A4R6SZZ6_9SPHI|nr:hypothetical protein [Pedobacter metabolipauper]TDQ10274.1 hypothetical protein ATK78_2440 [Pedobacter metabolipauper]
MKKQILIIFFIVTVCLISFFIFMKINGYKPNNGFTRKLIDLNIGEPKAIELPERFFYFAKKPNREIDLYSHHHPLIIYKIDESNNQIKSIRLKAAPTFNIKSNYIIIRFSPSEKLYLSNSEGSLEVLGSKQIRKYKIPLIYTDNCTPISDSSVIVRSIEGTGQDKSMSLVKIRLSNKSIENKRYTLPKHLDGYFGNDGFLRYDKENSRFIYSYLYSGEFLCLDTNLNLLYKSKTIDTVTLPKLKLGVFKTKLKNGKYANKTTQISPPSFINSDFAINNGFVYIISQLKADNESSAEFKENQPIDVYSIKDGKYQYSFYIPKYNRFKLKRIEVTSNQIIAIFDRYLVKYSYKS